MILKENGGMKVKITKDKYNVTLWFKRNSASWCGQTITPELARLSLEALTEYLKTGIK